MSDLRSLLDRHAAVPKRDLDVDAVLARARRRRLRSRIVSWVSVLAALGAIAFPVEQALVPAGPSGEVRTVQPPAPSPAQLPTPVPPGPGPSGANVSNSASSASSPALTHATPVAGPLSPNGSRPSSARDDGPNGQGATATAGRTSQTPAPSDVPVAPTPLRPGQYIYDYQVNGSSAAQAPLIVSSPANTANGRLQHESYTYNDSGYTVALQWDYLYDQAGMHQERYVRDVTFKGVPYDHMDCTSSSQSLILPTGVRRGDTWHVAKTCTDTLNGSSSSVATLSDTGAVQVQVGGQTMTAVDVSEDWGGGDLEDPYFDPANGLALEDQVNSASTGGSDTSYWEKVRSLTPS